MRSRPLAAQRTGCLTSARPAELKKLIRRGIPAALRGRVWPIISGAADMQALEKPDYYEELLRKSKMPPWSNSESIRQIERVSRRLLSASAPARPKMPLTAPHARRTC